ncbi:hypothetical protein O1611_g2813 [Lasiodiplodia mahajangana]|uniref:Uncharacterized protein n=1 Tax=Lasiodiplodia mahajangana TaxID=1108764 RepID=A0ACC2JTL9_9PEZI|nr:hypothetical protein O1611_g2813 [Lasiodiplodia mahajangana]
MESHTAGRPVEHARSTFKLSEALLQDRMTDIHDEAIALRKDADKIVKGNSTTTEFVTEGAYEDRLSTFRR